MLQLLYRGFFVCLVASAAASCEKNDDDVVPDPQPPVGVRVYPEADEELWPYFTRFEDEAVERGVTVDLSARQVRARILEIPENGVAGDCQFDEDEPNRLRIDRSTWDDVSENLREYIVFHELGHCVLIRKHREDADVHGTCLSIMASGTGDCNDVFNASTREKLLDELFDPARYGDWQ